MSAESLVINAPSLGEKVLGTDAWKTENLGENASASASDSGLTPLGYAGLASTVIGTLTNAWVGYSQSKRQADAYEFQARIAEINRKRATMQAQAALHNSNLNIARFTEQYGQVKSKQKVGMAANGIAVGFGSSKEVLATTDLYKQQDINTAYANGIYAALGYMSNATAQYQASVSALASRPSSGTVAVAGLTESINKVVGYCLDNTFTDYAKSEKRATNEATK